MNVTSSPTPSVRYWIYALEGAILLPTNGIIFITILYHNALRQRKEYFLPGALALCDTVEGTGALLAGLGRNWLMANNASQLIVSRRACLLKPWNWFWLFTHHFQDSTLFIISVDGLISIAWPLFHYGLTKTYATRLLFVAWTPGAIGLAYTVYTTSFETDPIRPNLCFTAHVYSSEYFSVLYILRVTLATSSVLLYILIIFLYWHHGKKQLALHGQGPQFQEYLKSQQRLTVTLGLSCVFTTLFYVIPILSRTIASYLGQMKTEIALTLVPYTYIMENCNRMLNILLYSTRHKNIRSGIVGLFACKQLSVTANGHIEQAPKVKYQRDKENVHVAWG